MSAQKKGQDQGEQQAQEQTIALPQFYTSVFTIGHSAQDFRIICFSSHTANNAQPDGSFHVGLSASHEILMSPVTAKELLRALKTNIGKYENKFGEISIPPEPKK